MENASTLARTAEIGSPASVISYTCDCVESQDLFPEVPDHHFDDCPKKRRLVPYVLKRKLPDTPRPEMEETAPKRRHVETDSGDDIRENVEYVSFLFQSQPF